MRNKLLWFYQEVDEPEPTPPPVDVNKPGPSRAGASSSTSKTPQGTVNILSFNSKLNRYMFSNKEVEICLSYYSSSPVRATAKSQQKYFKCLLSFHRNLPFRSCHKAEEVIFNRWMDLCFHWCLYLHFPDQQFETITRRRIPERFVSFLLLILLN